MTTLKSTAVWAVCIVGSWLLVAILSILFVLGWRASL